MSNPLIPIENSIRGFFRRRDLEFDDVDQALEMYLDYQWAKSTKTSKYFYEEVSKKREWALQIIQRIINN